MALTLYRRHTKHCTKDYPQNQRTFPPRTPREVRQDCECPIVVAGSLRLETRRILHVSTETNHWDKALSTAAQWEAWESLTNPSPAPASQDHMTITEASARWIELKGPHGENIGHAALRKYFVLLEQRIAPFCVEHGIQFISAFDNATVVTDCFLSFKNLNPHHNRKDQPAGVVPLADAMRRAELERFRGFLRFCVSQGWLKDNHGMKIRLGRAAPSAKYGLTPEEESQVWDAIELVSNRGQLDQYNSRELRALCLVMRYAGLRISDAVALDHTQLVRREHGDGYAIKIMAQQKTQEWVRVPITREVVDALNGLNFKGERDGRRYWFYTGNGERDTAVNNWRNRITRLFRLAQQSPYRPFAHPASTHTWRHTFAISMLNSGVDVKMVSRWLGHASIRVTEAHYGHANRATHVASEQAYDEALGTSDNEDRRDTGSIAAKIIQFRRTRTHAKTN